jgi:hypothetical protein
MNGKNEDTPGHMRGPYDVEPLAEEDLWFLPAPLEDEAPYALLPSGGSDEWAQAQAALAGPLARLALQVGALDAHLSLAGDGMRHRLALLEVAELSWHLGPRISATRLALWAALRLTGVQEDVQTLTKLSWAVRRLSGGAGPVEIGFQEFLDRRDVVEDEGAVSDRLAEWRSVVGASGLHPLTQSAMGFYLWPMAGLGDAGDPVEAAVVAARLGAQAGLGGAVFVPLALGGGGWLHQRGGGVETRMARWIAGQEQAVLTALRVVEDIREWEARAQSVTAGWSGRTPQRLLKVLADWPLVSAPMAQELCGVARASVQRNMTRLVEVGLVREVTGQGRYRFWSAVV